MVKDGNNVNYVKMEIMLMQMKGKTPHRWLKYTTRESVFGCPYEESNLAILGKVRILAKEV